MKLFIAITTSGLFLFLLMGCSANSRPGTGAANGTGDSGGGNMYKGRPLESYIRRPRDLDSYKEFVQIMLPEENLGQVSYTFRGMFYNKTWYFVPGPLRGLPNGKIGSAVPTDQVALQDFNAIWIDSDLFDKMTLEDQARILIHEFLLGSKLLKFDSYKHGCIIVSRESEREGCLQASDVPRGKPSDLSLLDYSQIRRTVDEIFRSTPTTSEDWENLLGSGGFDNPPSIVFRLKGSERKVTIDTVFNWIGAGTALAYVPTYGYDFAHLLNQYPDLATNPPKPTVDWKPHEPCAVNAKLLGDQISLRLTMGSKEISYTSNFYNEVTLKRRDYYGKNLWRARLVDMGTDKYKLGDHLYSIEFGFANEASFDYVEVVELACANADCSSMRNPKHGIQYICSGSNVLKYY